MSESGSGSRTSRLRSARRLARLFFLGLFLLGGLGVLLAELPPSQPGRFSEASADFVVGLSPSRVWSKLQDLSLAHHYVPGVEAVEILTAQRQGVGASRRIFQEGGETLDETVIEWEEGRGFVIRLHAGEQGPPPPFEEAKFRYWIESGDDAETRISLTILYLPMGGLLGEWLDTGLLNAEMERRMRALAASMRSYYELPEPVR